MGPLGCATERGGVALGFLERVLDLPPCAVDALDVVAGDYFVKDKAPQVCSEGSCGEGPP